MGLVLISHDLGVIAETVDRVLVMYAGRAVEAGPVREVFARLAHPYARGLFSAMPRIAPGQPHPRTPLPTIAGIVPDLHDLPAACAFAERCNLAEPRCRAEFPPAVSIGPAHRAECWRTDQTLGARASP